VGRAEGSQWSLRFYTAPIDAEVVSVSGASKRLLVSEIPHLPRACIAGSGIITLWFVEDNSISSAKFPILASTKHSLMKTFFLALAASSLLSSNLLAQQSLKDLETFMFKVRNRQIVPLPLSILNDNSSAQKLIDRLGEFSNDTVEDVRSKARYLAGRLAAGNKEKNIRQSGISILLNGVGEKSSGLAGSAIDGLTRFSKEDFTSTHKDTIANHLTARQYHVEKLLRVAGYVGLENHQEKIRTLIVTAPTPKIKWAARVTLARMGDAESVNYIMNKLQTAKVDDAFVYQVVPDLVYTRSRTIFNFLDGLIKDDNLQCESADPDSGETVACAYRIMEAMVPYVVGVPIKLSNSGDIIEKDYRDVLLKLRHWINVNPGYEIESSSM
jgi:hypothetical protein